MIGKGSGVKSDSFLINILYRKPLPYLNFLILRFMERVGKQKIFL